MNTMDIRRKQILAILYIPAILFLIWFLNKLGESGSGYFIITLQVFLLPIIMFWGFLPRVMGKLLRSRMSKGQYKNADIIWKSSFIYSLITGILCTVLFLCISDLFTDKILSLPKLGLGFKLFIPVLFFFSISFVLKGYFQGMGSGMPTVISNIVFFVCTGLFGNVIIKPMLSYGLQVSDLLQNPEFTSMYGSAGFSIGVVIGSVFSLVFLILLFAISGTKKRKHVREGMRVTENYSIAFRLILFSLLPHMICAFLLLLPLNLDFIFLKDYYTNITDAVKAYGHFYENFLVILILVLFNLVTVFGFYQKYVQLIKKEEYKHGRDCMQASLLWMYMSAGLMSMVLISIFKIYSGILVFLLTVSVFLCMVLWKLGKVKEILAVFGIAALVHSLVSFWIMKFNLGNINSILFAYLAQISVIMILLGILIFKSYRIGLGIIRAVLLPFLCICIAGVVTLLICKPLISLFGTIGGITVCAVTGGLINLILLIVFRCLRLRDMYLIPGGKIFLFIGKLLHIVK